MLSRTVPSRLAVPQLLPTTRLAASLDAVRVTAPGRLHLGFLDPAGSLGRRFGSLGLMIDGFETEVEIRRNAADAIEADATAESELDRATDCLQRLRERTGCNAPLALRLGRVLPAHAGFGSGTQLALAVGRAFARWHGLDVTTPQLAAWLGRGKRSGVGIAGFDHGGLLLDGGPSATGAPAPLLARQDLPAAWRVIVVQDDTSSGLSGVAERDAIAQLPALPQAQAADLCHQVLLRVLPGVANDDFDSFAAGVNRLQDVLGAHFAPAQGGSAWTSVSVARLMPWLRAHAPGSIAVGQSSWGPTGFAILPSAHVAETLIAAARAAGVVDPGLSLRIVAARNHGASVSAVSATR
jgi:beta-ribofuranosylaminobenzene 5'-phosphate synthase